MSLEMSSFSKPHVDLPHRCHVGSDDSDSDSGESEGQNLSDDSYSSFERLKFLSEEDEEKDEEPEAEQSKEPLQSEEALQSKEAEREPDDQNLSDDSYSSYERLTFLSEDDEEKDVEEDPEQSNKEEQPKEGKQPKEDEKPKEAEQYICKPFKNDYVSLKIDSQVGEIAQSALQKCQQLAHHKLLGSMREKIETVRPHLLNFQDIVIYLIGERALEMGLIAQEFFPIVDKVIIGPKGQRPTHPRLTVTIVDEQCILLRRRALVKRMRKDDRNSETCFLFLISEGSRRLFESSIGNSWGFMKRMVKNLVKRSRSISIVIPDRGTRSIRTVSHGPHQVYPLLTTTTPIVSEFLKIAGFEIQNSESDSDSDTDSPNLSSSPESLGHRLAKRVMDSKIQDPTAIISRRHLILSSEEDSESERHLKVAWSFMERLKSFEKLPNRFQLLTTSGICESLILTERDLKLDFESFDDWKSKWAESKVRRIEERWEARMENVFVLLMIPMKKNWNEVAIHWDHLKSNNPAYPEISKTQNPQDVIIQNPNPDFPDDVDDERESSSSDSENSDSENSGPKDSSRNQTPKKPSPKVVMLRKCSKCGGASVGNRWYRCLEGMQCSKCYQRVRRATIRQKRDNRDSEGVGDSEMRLGESETKKQRNQEIPSSTNDL